MPVILSQPVSGDGVSETSPENNAEDQARNPLAADTIDESDLTLSFTDEEAPLEEPLQVFGFWDLMRMVLVLALVVGMIYAVYFLLKRSRKKLEEESNFISLLSSQALPGGRQLYIIDVAGRVYLLGAGDGSLSLITEIEDKPSIDALRLDASRQQAGAKTFSQLMSSFFVKSPNDDQEKANHLPDVGFTFLRQQRKRLKRL